MSQLSQARATFYVLVAACCFGSVAIFTVLGRQGGASLHTILTWRYLLGSLGLMLAAGGPAAVRATPRQVGRLLLLGGGGQTLVTLTSLASLEYISAATLGFLFYTYPAWITAIAAVRGTEPLTPLRVIALLLSLAGITLMVGNPFTTALPMTGILLALGSALIYAIYIPLLNGLGAGLPPAVTSTWLTLGASIIIGATGLALGELSLFDVSARSWLAIAGFALISTVLAFIVFLKGLAALGPVRTAIVSTVEPFWTAIAGAVLLAQPLTKGAVAGGALIAVAVALLQWRPRAARPR